MPPPAAPNLTEDDFPQGKLPTLRLRRPSPTAAAETAKKEEEDEEEEEEEEDEPLSPAARVFHQPSFNCYIVAILGCKTRINPAVVKPNLKATMLKHPRFTSKVVVDEKRGGKMKWVRTKVNLDEHIIIPDIDPNMESADQFLEDYMTNLTRTPLDLSKPLWELHLLNLKTSDAEAIGIFRLHHSIGDGISLIYLLLACSRKTSDPTALPTLPTPTRSSLPRIGRGFWSLWVVVGLLLRLLWNSVVDILLLVATSMLFLKDTPTPIKAAAPPADGVLTPRRFVHRTVSFRDIKTVKNAMNTTVNDVILGVTQAGLTRYLDRRYAENKESLPDKIRLRSAILINIRPSPGIQALADMLMKKSKFRWGNHIGYIILPFAIAHQRDPLDYVRQAKATIDRKKFSLESIYSYFSSKLTQMLFGDKLLAAMISRAQSNTTMSYSNVVGPLEEIGFHGHAMTYFAASVYGHHQALTIHYQSYIDKMTIALAVDPDVIPDPHQLLDDLEESLELIRDAVIEKIKQ